MADDILDAVREKYPQYKDIPDDKLTLAIGTKYPQYLKNQDFSNSFSKFSQPPTPAPAVSTPAPQQPFNQTPQPNLGNAGIPIVNAQPQPPKAIAFPPHAWTPQQLSQLTPPPEPREGLATSLPRAAVEDVAAGMDMAFARKDKVADAQRFSGNIPAAIMGKDLPMDEIIKQISTDKDEIPAATAAKISTGVASVLPQFAVGFASLPAWAQKVATAAFTLDMARNIPDTAKQLGTELGKPKEQQDPDKISSLLSDATQQLLFTAAGAKHLEGAGREAIAQRMIDKYVPRGTGIQSKGVKNASAITSPASVPQQQVRPQVGEETPLQQQGQAAPAQESVAKETQVRLSDQMRQEAATNYGAESKWPKDVKDDIAAQQRKESAKPTPIEEVNLTGLDPEHQKMLDIERGNTDVPVDVISQKEMESKEGDPFARKMMDTLSRSIATIDRNKNRIVINPVELNEWLNRIPASQRQQALRSLIGEERIHLATDDAAAKTYWSNLTGLEQAIAKRRYGNTPGMNDTLWGHEALRFRMQQLARMTPREIAEAAGAEKWTVKGLTVLETAIRGIRETLGTKASSESKGILDRIQKNLDLGKTVASGSTPGAVDKAVQDRAEKEAQKLEEQAQMYIESGDAESGNELKQMAAKLRDQTGEQHFPAAYAKQDYSPEDLERYKALRAKSIPNKAEDLNSPEFQQAWRDFEKLRNKYGGMPPKQLDQQNFPAARPKKRSESVFQDKFILPGMETQQAAGTGMAVPVPGTEAPPVPETERTTAEASGAMPRLTGAEIERRGLSWGRNAIADAIKASQEGKHPSPPTFKDFVEYMRKQESKLQPGQLHEMWQRATANTLDSMSGEEIGNLAKSLFGRGSVFGKAKIADKPPEGFKLEEVPDRTAPERYQDERKAARTQQFREKAIGALYKRLVQPQLREEALPAERKTVTPSEIRYGGGTESSGYQSFDARAQTDPNLGQLLVDEARVSKDAPASLTKRLTVLQNKKTGQIEMVSTYNHPSTGVVMRDPLSPMGDSSPLSSIQNRYRVLYSILLDQPVKKFRQSYASLPEYMEKFGKEAQDNYSRETSYDPNSVPLDEFLESTTGRIEGPEGEGGLFQGLHKDLVAESGRSAMDESSRTPLTDSEAAAIFDHVVGEVGDPTSPEDVEASLTADALSKNRQALSGISKLGRALGKEYPFASGDELKQKLSDRIFQAHKDSKDLEQFQKKLMAEAKGGENFPMAAPKDDYNKMSRDLDNDLFRLSTQYMADVEDTFPQIADLRKKYENDIPKSEVEKVYHKLDEEFTLGNSGIQLTPNGQKLFDEAANLASENQALYDAVKKINPGAVQGREYWPRMAKDVNSIFQRVARGVKRGITEGTLLSRSAWFTKRRLIHAFTDQQGNRSVGVLTPDGKVVFYDKNKGSDMGHFAWGDVAKRQDLMEKELEPVMKEVEALFDERAILERSPARAAISQRRIRNINKELADLWNQKNAIEGQYPQASLDDKVWQDKNGKQWKLGEATTGEIERNMDVRYYHEPFSILIGQNLKLRQMLRSATWLEKFKNTPQFQRIARKADERNLPPDWKQTDVPQLRGYVFEPHLADVLNQFQERSKGKDPNVLTAMNRLLMNAVFFDNPFLHTPNLASWWFTTRGALAWVNPAAYGRLLKTFPRAFTDVSEKTPEYSNYLRAGTPLQFTRMREFSQNVTKLLGDQLESDPTWAKKIANFLGYANPIKLSQSIGHAATAGLHDILTMQLIYEMRLKHPGMKPVEAMGEVTKIMPDYRVPARVLGSTHLSKLITNPNFVWFGAYHYSEGKAFMNMAKGALAGKEMSRGEALDKIAAIALLSYVAYPIIDDIVQKVTGRKYLAFRRAGPTTWPSAIASVARGERTPTQVTPSFVSPSAATTAAISLLYNTALGNRGAPIYNPKQGIAQSAKDIGKFVAGQFNQGQVYRDLASGKTDWDSLWLNLLGVRKDYSKEPQNKIYGWAYDWAQRTGNEKLLRQFNQRAMETYPPSKYSPLKNFLADGDTAKARTELQKLMASGTTPAEVERELRPTAHPLSGLKATENQFVESLTPGQRATYAEEMAKREKVYRSYLELSGQ